MTHLPKPIEVPPAPAAAVLPAANWADAFEITTHHEKTDMRVLAEQMLTVFPVWADRLLALRNVLVAPFGLKTGGAGETDDLVGIFPVLESGPDRMVLGLDDWHLDFRILLERTSQTSDTRLRLTTFVTRHNLFGRTYIALITPFHKMIVRSVMRRANK